MDTGVDLERIGRRTREAAIETFEIMIDGLALRAGPPGVADPPPPESEATAIVGFAGPYVGFVSVHGSADLARLLAARMLAADDETSIELEEVRDGFGEIANMVAGGLKTRCDEDGIAFEMSVPFVVMAPQPMHVYSAGSRAMAVVSGEVDGRPFQVCAALAPAARGRSAAPERPAA